MPKSKAKNKHHICFVNIGLYRSGTTTLAEAAKRLGMNVHRKYPILSPEYHLSLIENPQQIVLEWYSKEGLKELVHVVSHNDFVCDGWFALLPLLPEIEFDRFKKEAMLLGTHVVFIATKRDIIPAVISELQHWTIHGLEEKANLTVKQSKMLECNIKKRAEDHGQNVQLLHEKGKLKILSLHDRVHEEWSRVLYQNYSKFHPK